MGDYLLRKCVATKGSGMPVPTGEGRVLDVVVSPAASSGCKTRRILHGAEEEEEAYSSVGPGEQQGFRICHKRARSCCIIMHTPPPAASCSSGNIVHVGSVVSSSSLCAASSGSSSSATDEVGLPEPYEERTRAKEKERNQHLRLQGMAAFSSGGGKQGERRLRISHQTVMTGEHSSLESSSSASSCVAPSSSSSCNNSQEEEPEPEPEPEADVESKLGELESTEANTGPAPVSRSTTVAVAHPDLDEIEAFFAKAEEELRQAFANKYNYDIVKDTPLEGRYEWVRIKPPQ